MKDHYIEIVYVRPGERAVVKTIKNQLEVYQELVEGYIDILRWEGLTIICNDEGKLNNMRRNRCLADEDGMVLDVIHGPFIVCDVEGEEFASLNEEKKEKALRLFGRIQVFQETPLSLNIFTI